MRLEHRWNRAWHLSYQGPSACYHTWECHQNGGNKGIWYKGPLRQTGFDIWDAVWWFEPFVTWKQGLLYSKLETSVWFV